MIDVTCAVIRNEDDEILVVQRGEGTDHPYKWEFPGGKVARGEQLDECIIREVKEELSMDIVIFKKLHDVEYDYGHKQIRLIPFVCDTLEDIPFLSEHIAYKWMNINDLLTVDFSEADIFVAEEYVIAFNPEKHEAESVNEPAAVLNDEEILEMVNRIMGSKEAEWVAASLIENPVLLKRFVEYSYSKDQKIAFHSSWILTKACDRVPGLLHPYMPGIIESLADVESESTLRSFLRILSLSDLKIFSQKHQGLLADLCFRQLNSSLTAIAIKAYSMEILYKLTLIYPGLATELAVSVRSLMDLQSAGIVSKAKTILKRLNK